MGGADGGSSVCTAAAPSSSVIALSRHVGVPRRRSLFAALSGWLHRSPHCQTSRPDGRAAGSRGGPSPAGPGPGQRRSALRRSFVYAGRQGRCVVVALLCSWLVQMLSMDHARHLSPNYGTVAERLVNTPATRNAAAAYVKNRLRRALEAGGLRLPHLLCFVVLMALLGEGSRLILGSGGPGSGKTTLMIRFQAF